MRTFWLIYNPLLSRCYRGATVEDAVAHHNKENEPVQGPYSWDDLSLKGWKLCYVEDYS